jgi:two-component system CheB/CheR fusion protein
MSFRQFFQAPFTLMPRSESRPSSGPNVSASQKVFVVDDEYFSRALVRLMLEEAGWEVEDFESCEAFLSGYRSHPDACLVLDVHFAGMGAPELLDAMKREKLLLQTVIISGSSGISDAVQLIKAGACDFIEKPVNQANLLTGVRHAFTQSADARASLKLREASLNRLNALTPREHQVMRMVLAGNPSKNIAADLGISQRTVENHRASIMHKTGSKSLPALGRLAQTLSL